MPFKGQCVLVVGFGNSDGEIAIDLYEEGARPTLAVRNAVNVIEAKQISTALAAKSAY